MQSTPSWPSRTENEHLNHCFAYRNNASASTGSTDRIIASVRCFFRSRQYLLNKQTLRKQPWWHLEHGQAFDQWDQWPQWAFLYTHWLLLLLGWNQFSCSPKDIEHYWKHECNCPDQYQYRLFSCNCSRWREGRRQAVEQINSITGKQKWRKVNVWRGRHINFYPAKMREKEAANKSYWERGK